MAEPKIDTDGISEEEKLSEKFQSAYSDMLSQLTAPGFIPVLCAHEAAHLIYFSQIGARQFDPLPATIGFDPAIDDYVGHLAAIQVLNLPPWKPGKFWDWFFVVACAHAAGGVVARRLMPSSDGGDKNDSDRFKLLCDQLNTDPNVSIDFEDVWTKAQCAVCRRFKKPAKHGRYRRTGPHASAVTRPMKLRQCTEKSRIS